MQSLILAIGNQNYSSWSLRPWLAMKHFGLEFEEIRIPLYQPGSSEQIRRYSPAGKVPVLQHGAVTVWESLAILEYLAEIFPEHQWWPEDIAARAMARAISAEMHTGFQALREQMLMNCRAKFPGKGISDEVQQDIDRITTIWRTCRQQYDRKGEGLFGAFSIADAMFAPVVLRFHTYGVELDVVCQTYAAFVLALPAMKIWLQAAELEPEVLPQYEM
jgi:glutathione S-transferase